MQTVLQTSPELDSALQCLIKSRSSCLRLTLAQRIELLKCLRRDFFAVCPQWIEASLLAKGIAPGSAQEAEEWLAGPFCVLRNLRFLERSLEGIERRGLPELPGKAHLSSLGQVCVPVLPSDHYDRLFYMGFQAEVRLQDRIGLEGWQDGIAAAYRSSTEESSQAGRIVLVLGAGNVSSIGPMDVLHKIFVECKSVLLKMHPVNRYLGPLIEEGFRSLIEAGLLRVVEGGAEVGEYLCRHPAVDEIHITGSDRTHDAIVYGGGEEGRRRKAEGRPFLDKPISSELGNVSPVIVVPGRWSASDLRFQAANLVSMLVNNAGFNCNALKVAVLPRGWEQREPLLDEVRHLLSKVPLRQAYYPGAQQRHREFLEGHGHAEHFGKPSAGQLPWTLVAELPPRSKDERLFQQESFCGLFAETALDASSPERFLDAAVEFVNDHLWGTLSAAVIAHPRSLRDPATAQAAERALDRLRYGTVALNHWPALGYGMATTSWGAYPGHSHQDIQSGIGVVHNTYMLSPIEKTVLRGPFRVRPTPAWFVTHKNPTPLARRLTAFEASPGPGKAMGILRHAVLFQL